MRILLVQPDGSDSIAIDKSDVIELAAEYLIDNNHDELFDVDSLTFEQAMWILKKYTDQRIRIASW